MAHRTHKLHQLLARTPEHLRVCAHCGTREQPSLDHIVPISRGGSDAWANIQILCRPCNRRKGDSLDKRMGPFGKMSPALRAPQPPAINQHARRPLSALSIDELWGQYESAHHERGWRKRRQRLDAIAGEIHRRGIGLGEAVAMPRGEAARDD